MNQINFDEFPDRYKEKCRKWDKEKIEEHFGIVPNDIIPMWIADMDFKASQSLQKALHDAVDIGVFGYTYVYDEFYEVIQAYYRIKNQLELQKDWITLCYGTVGALHNVVQAFCDKDDYVIIQTPVYEPFYRSINVHGANCIQNDLIIDDVNRYQIDFIKLEEQLQQYHPKIFICCSPHNPSGRIWSAQELSEVIRLCNVYQVLLVVDEVHSGMIHKGPFVSTTQYLDEEKNIIILSSPNKMYNIGGLKTSYAIIRNKETRARFHNQLVKNSVTSPSVFGIIACISCYKDGASWLKECMHYIQKNYEYMTTFIDQELHNVSYMRMESSYLLWMDIRKTGITSETFTHELAKNHGVLVESGTNFVGNGEGWIRINLGTQYCNVESCCHKIKYFLESKV